MTAYCEQTDLLLGDDILLPTHLSKPKFIELAASDMDSKLGFVYVVPIATGTLPYHQKALLKSINAKLATGRLIMAMAVGGQDSTVHQYALFLVQEAERDLMAIANGTVDLTAPLVDGTGTPLPPIADPLEADPYAKTPTGWNPDASSPVTAFEKTFFGDDPYRTQVWPWKPATNVVNDGAVSEPR